MSNTYGEFMIHVAEKMEASGKYDEADITEELVRMYAIENFTNAYTQLGRLTIDEMITLVKLRDDVLDYCYSFSLCTGDMVRLAKTHIEAGHPFKKNFKFGLLSKDYMDQHPRISKFIEDNKIYELFWICNDIDFGKLLDTIRIRKDGMQQVCKMLKTDEQVKLAVDEYLKAKHPIDFLPSHLMTKEIVRKFLKNKSDAWYIFRFYSEFLTDNEYAKFLKQNPKFLINQEEVNSAFEKVFKKTRRNFKKEYAMITDIAETGGEIKAGRIKNLFINKMFDLNFVYNMYNEFRESEVRYEDF